MLPQEINYSGPEKLLVPIEIVVFIEKNLFEMKLLCDNTSFVIVLRDPYTGQEVLLPKIFPISALEEKISLGIIKDMFAGQEDALEDLYAYARKQLTPHEILTLEQDDQIQRDILGTAVN